MSSTDDVEAARELFLKINLAEETAKNALKNSKFLQTLIEIIKEASAEEGCPKTQGALLYAVAGKFPANALIHRKELLDYIMKGDIKTNAQLDGAMDFLKGLGPAPLDTAAFEEASGVGVEVSVDQIREAVADIIKQNEEALKEDRYHFNVNLLLAAVRSTLKWADVSVVRAELDGAVERLLGPKTEADMQKKEKKKKVKSSGSLKKEKSKASLSTTNGKKEDAEEAWKTADPFAFLPKPADNHMVHTEVHFSDGRVMRISNTLDKLKAHLQETGGKVVTRFPPEPNGYLHIGHGKAMFIDFGMAEQYNGVCILRYDDTNPEAEKQEYIDHIQDIVKWMGWKPWKITYSSDYFQELYDLAVQLIKRGHAYVCHQTGEEIAKSREAREPSPWRDRPIEESLSLFDDMRRGLIDEGKATLRMKMDHKNDNYNMFDLIAYRIKFTPHPHAGDKWCIYPSYDYTHCLVDSLENITHSLCTLEFESRRASYYWLLEVLDVYKPLVWEYSRLNVTHNVLSKRKLQALVKGGHVDGWDDPRLLTLAGLRRRGVTPTAINTFCREVGVTRSDNSDVHLHKLDHHIRADLDSSSSRQLAVLRPLRCLITNLPEDHCEEVEAKLFPGRSDGSYKVPLTRVVYIDRTDFRDKDSKDYYGLAPNKSVMLRYAYPISCTGFSTDDSGNVTEVAVECDRNFLADGKKPPKGVLNWVSEPAPGQLPPTFEARLYDVLFKSESPGSLDNWVEDLNPNSKEIVSGAYGNPHLAKAKPGDRFQLERLGFFCVDIASTPEQLVLNRTCTLKESFPKFTSKK